MKLCEHLVVVHLTHEVILAIADRAHTGVHIGSPMSSVLRDHSELAIFVLVQLHTLKAYRVELTQR